MLSAARKATASEMRSSSLRISEFLSQNHNLPAEYCGFLINPKVDLYGRIRISVVLPADSEVLEPSSKRGWRRLLSKWLERSKAYNDKTGASKAYLAGLPSPQPQDLVRWIKRKEQDLIDGDDDAGSYEDLRDTLNRSIFDLVQRAFELQNDDNELWRSIGQQSLKSAREIMSFFNVSRSDQDDCIRESLERYEEGLPLFKMIEFNKRRLRKPRPHGPVSREAVIAKLRYLKKLYPTP